MIDRRRERSISVAEMRILKWISGMTRKYKMRNEYLKQSNGVTSIVDKRK